MAALFKRTSVAVTTCLGVLGMAGIVGFAAGFNARAGLSAFNLAEMSASDTVSLRFPNDWTEAAATLPMTLAFASADAALALFDPMPIYSLATEQPSPPAVEAPQPPISAAQPAAAVPAKLAVAAATRSVRRSNAVLNDSQIASIKKRLNLTPDQERYWHAVEAELRKMEYKKDQKSPQGTRTAVVDMSKVNVEGLKSAGFPLVMSFSDDQRQELKSLAHLLGLESVISSF
jgi:pyruvate/2-oxoglutarate dehydrogenase complex dihydrolipoamide acyltransferase (E2) component